MAKLNADYAIAKQANRGAVEVPRWSRPLFGASAVVFEGVTNLVMLEALACRGKYL